MQTAVCANRFESCYGKLVFHMAAEERDLVYTIFGTLSLSMHLANGQRKAKICMFVSQF
jgi:hypothetical protein